MADISLYGIYRDELFDVDGRNIFDSGWKKNLIVTSCRVLLSDFMSGDGTAKGIQTMQVGRGRPEWDVPPPPPPDPDTTVALVDGAPFTLPNGSLQFQFLDSSDAIVPGPT